ncbi:MAG: trypsin-like peptidase domain-containing protein [Colwellia sp.]|nr:trypsin-like peptidase domain-containing protein [Colwellia sp.]MCW8866076.1 trypsin-like peptidase domain-containing protein [Colwellia sp.]MCW9083107.1 trypsin-like peptidase domain-containing protein [Colwellia sp.]
MYLIRIILLTSLTFITSCASAENTIQTLYKSVNPAVVELHVKALADPKPGQAAYKASVAGSLGSGALINSKGRILTAAHVVDKATEIEVVYADGTKTSGHVVWVESMIDLAMIQAVDVPDNIEPLKLAKRTDYQIGEQVIVIGAPYGVSHSLSVGYLSGIRDGKPIPATDITPRLLQTDASINVGNSGGPMFNSQGEIIGIVSHILSKSGGSNGLGFVVSIDTIHDIMDSDPGTFSGFIPFLLNEKQSYALNNAAGHGMLIQHVVPRTLADKLGFKGGNVSVTIGHTSLLLGGDILLAINGNKITDIESAIKIKQRMANVKKGDEISFTFLRAGEVNTVYWQVEAGQY